MARFNNKVVVVTGGGAGIGRAITRLFAKEGAKVVIADIDREAGLNNLSWIKENGGEAIFVETNVAVEESVKKMVETTVKNYGGIDILINNAGIAGSRCPIYDRPVEDWDRVLNVNLKGTYMCSKYAAIEMIRKKTGVIINIASTRALMSEAHTEPYSASKGGILALTHSLAISLGPTGIRVNAICPGWIEVRDWQKPSKKEEVYHSEADKLQHPVGRVGKPEDVAQACLFLASEEAGFITGTNLVIDGGMTVKMIYVE